ncbi:MAG: ArsA family ATPase [Deltaproteobacteria bacterium]|nr:ArsA family ATPase [Deltaproteobacteria bacterium]
MDRPAKSTIGLPIEDLFGRQVHLVTGKGGVGKSTVACALAVHFMGRGERVLLTQVNAKDSHAGLLGIEKVPDDVHQISELLSVVNISPSQSLKEYALMHLKFEAVYKTVFENRLTKAFLRFIPSLSQLNMMGKLWFHAEEKTGGRPRFDRLIIDAPATGHALDLLRVAQVVNDVTTKGPMAEKTRQMQETFQDPTRSCMHVVTFAEEMPANETHELLAKAEMEGLIPLGMVVVNQLRERLFDEPQRQWLSQARDIPLRKDLSEDARNRISALVALGHRRRVREDLEREQSERLSELALQVPRVDFPFIARSPFVRAQIDTLAKRLDFEREARK